MNNYNEDDVLDTFKGFLENNGFLVLSISGKQQGLYRFSIGNYRKGPDIVAIKQNILLVGEGKKLSGMLFNKDIREISDYNSMIYFLDHKEAQQELLDCLPDSLKPNNDRYLILACVVGSTSFAKHLTKVTDKRIKIYQVSVKEKTVKEIAYTKMK